MKAQIRHRLLGGAEVIDAETGRVIAEMDTADDAAALIARLEAEEQSNEEPGFLDYLFGGSKS